MKKPTPNKKVIQADYKPNFSHLKKLNYIDVTQAAALPIYFLTENGKTPNLWVRPFLRMLNPELNQFLIDNPDIEQKFKTLAQEVSNTKDGKSELVNALSDFTVTNYLPYIVKGWDNIFDADGVEIPFSFENFTALYNAIENQKFKNSLVDIIVNFVYDDTNFTQINKELRELSDLTETGKKS